MTDLEYQSDPIDIEPGTLRNAVETINGISENVTGTGEALRSDILAGGEQFSDAVSDSVSQHGPKAVNAALDLTGTCTYAGSVCSAMADDMTDYQDELKRLDERFENEKEEAGSDLNKEQFVAWKEKRKELVKELEGLEEDAEDELRDSAKERAGQLEDGPTPEHIQSLVGGGNMNWITAANLWGADAGEPPPSVQEEYGEKTGEIMKRGAEGDLSKEDMDTYNRYVEIFGGHKAFNVAALDTVGGDGYVEFAASVGDSSLDPALVAATQSSAAVMLASGTNSNTEGDWVGKGWMADFMQAGESDIELANGETVPGYLAVSPMLEATEYQFDDGSTQNVAYSSSFLVPVSEHLMRLDALPQWQEKIGAVSGDDNPFAAAGEKVHQNPLNSAMVALNRNPTAAGILFSQDAGSWASDKYSIPGGTTFEGTRLNDENMQSLVLSGLDRGYHDFNSDQIDSLKSLQGDGFAYLEHTLDGHSSANLNLAGNAIEAGATGVPAGGLADMDPQDVPDRTENGAEIATRVIDYVGGSAEDGDDSGETIPIGEGERLDDMADNFAQISVRYMSDLQNNLSGYDESSWAHDIEGPTLGLEDRDPNATMFLRGLGRNDDAAVTVASGSLVHGNMLFSTSSEGTSVEDMEKDYAKAYGGHSEVMGAIGAGRVDEVFSKYSDSAKGEKHVSDLISTGVKSAVSAGTSAIPGGSFIDGGAGLLVDATADGAKSDQADAASTAAVDITGSTKNMTQFGVETHVRSVLEERYPDMSEEEITDLQESIGVGVAEEVDADTNQAPRAPGN